MAIKGRSQETSFPEISAEMKPSPKTEISDGTIMPLHVWQAEKGSQPSASDGVEDKSVHAGRGACQCALCRPCAALMPRAYFARRMSIHVSPSSRITGHMSRFVYGCMWRVVWLRNRDDIPWKVTRLPGKFPGNKTVTSRKQLRERKGGSPGKSGLGQGEVAAYRAAGPP